ARRQSFFAKPVPVNTVAKPDAPPVKPEAPPAKPETPAANPAVSVALITEAVRVSGARRQLQETIQTFRPSLAAANRPTDLSAKECQQIINEALELDRLNQVMERSVSGTVDDSTLTNIVRWYASPLGRKIASAEINAYSPDTPARFQRYSATLREKEPTANR